jgi:hypothetical protein
LKLLLAYGEERKVETEEYWYGKPKLNAALSINPGDEVYVFRTSARNARNGDPQMYLKIKRANGKVDVVPVE